MCLFAALTNVGYSLNQSPPPSETAAAQPCPCVHSAPHHWQLTTPGPHSSCRRDKSNHPEPRPLTALNLQHLSFKKQTWCAEKANGQFISLVRKKDLSRAFQLLCIAKTGSIYLHSLRFFCPVVSCHLRLWKIRKCQSLLGMIWFPFIILLATLPTACMGSWTVISKMNG